MFKLIFLPVYVLAIALSGCSHKDISKSEPLVIAASELSENPLFRKMKTGEFEGAFSDGGFIRIFRYSFANQNDLENYMVNRRLLLHKGFQDQIAPYFGLVQLNRACLSKVDVKGQITSVTASEEQMKMEFPAADNKTLADCSGEKFWGEIEYQFHNCKQTNELFEIRKSFPVASLKHDITFRCR